MGKKNRGDVRSPSAPQPLTSRMSSADKPAECRAPAHTAVLVIDVQAGLFGSKPPPLEADAVLGRINEVTTKARAAGVPVILIQQDGDPKGDWLVPLSDDWRLHPKLKVEHGDLIIRKTTCDAFYRTSLESELRARQITTLVLTGAATDFCVDATLRNALSKEFAVIVVADAHTTSDSPMLKADLIRQHHNWAWAESISATGVTIVPATALVFTRRNG
jgi:nicotinamidase-related amidase